MSILALLGSIPQIISLISQLVGLFGTIKKSLQVDPVQQQADAQKAQQAAQQAAGSSDDTSGIFGGDVKK